MYRFQVISDGYIIFSTNEYNNFVDLVNNTKFDFDFIQIQKVMKLFYL